ncbi:phosphohistidine phosphatase [Hymenobacter psoromatis]|nr:phosphohistidine phosphatase [Hymenobacter psoromatis]
MRTLYLMRHAKSSWSFDELSDQERPLNDRGRDDAPRMGKALAGRRIVPDLIVSSPAVRAMSTAVLVARELKYSSANIVVEPDIYQADVDTLLAVIRGLPDTAPAVLLTGHNPTLTDVANHLSPSPLSGEMPTAAVICLRFQTEKWVDIVPQNAEFYFYDSPKS